nr:hypothetical protein Iba_chr15bCG4070 [Ipomoea batatas]
MGPRGGLYSRRKSYRRTCSGGRFAMMISLFLVKQSSTAAGDETTRKGRQPNRRYRTGPCLADRAASACIGSPCLGSEVMTSCLSGQNKAEPSNPPACKSKPSFHSRQSSSESDPILPRLQSSSYASEKAIFEELRLRAARMNSDPNTPNRWINRRSSSISAASSPSSPHDDVSKLDNNNNESIASKSPTPEPWSWLSGGNSEQSVVMKNGESSCCHSFSPSGTI